jgi:4-hydroxy-4-methyl-2-oxoglutarate aldolase
LIPDPLDSGRLGSATLHEALGRAGALPSEIRPLDPSMRLWGPAFTVACAPGQNLAIHEALYIASAGDVLVVDVGSGYEYGYWGEILTVAAQSRSLAGLVIDGGVRDGDRIIERNFPVFTRRRCIRGTGKAPGSGTINQPIRIGEVTIEPRDLVVGDGDGVVVIPSSQADVVLAAARTREDDEARIMERLESGQSTLEVYGFDTVDPAQHF